jgi:hypothetical protein
MAKWSDTGHAMRRRMGAPSSHHESAGKSMARNHMSPKEILASAEHANSSRRYMGMDAMQVNNVSGTPQAGTLIGKKNTQAGDPTAGGKANRQNIPSGNAAQSERSGARFRISVSTPMVDPAAGPTMANARTVPAVPGQSGNFVTGMNPA